MTITLDLTTIGILLWVFCSLTFQGLAWYGVSRVGIDAEAFGAQVRKLLTANNRDRAIKLCNAVPDDGLSRAVRKLLLVIDRDQPDAYDEVYEQGKLIVDEYMMPYTEPGTQFKWRVLGLLIRTVDVSIIYAFQPSGFTFALTLLVWFVVNIGVVRIHSLRAKRAAYHRVLHELYLLLRKQAKHQQQRGGLR